MNPAGKLFGAVFNTSASKAVVSKIPEAPPLKLPEAATFKHSDGSTSSSSSYDQHYVDAQVKFRSENNFENKIIDGGNNLKSPGAAPPGHLQLSIQAEIKKMQANRDAESVKKLFGESASGEVNGRSGGSFSSETFEASAENVVVAAAKAPAAAVPAVKTLLKTALVTGGVTGLIGVVSGSATEYLKPVLNPGATAATKKSIEEGKVVDQTQKDVFLAVNTLAKLRNEDGINTDLKWAMKSNDERMESLENMLDILEEQYEAEAQKHGIPFQLASIGMPGEDIASRSAAIESRLAPIGTLFDEIAVKLKSQTA